MRLVAAFALLITACAPVTGPSTTTTSTVPTTATTVVEAPRRIELSVTSDGSTEPIEFTVPTGTRSVGVTTHAGESSVIGIAELTLADGLDRVGIDRIPAVLLENIADQHVRLLPGDVFQEAASGVHAFVYPNYPFETDALPAGEARLRLVTTARSVDVVIALPPVEESLTLRVDVLAVGSQVPSAALERAADLLAPAGISLSWEVVVDLETTFSGAIDDRSVADLVAAAEPVGTDAIDVFVVPELPVSGMSPRIPGPLPPSPLAAVLVEATRRPSDLGRVIAHELSHYLGLHHLELFTDDNRPIEDPIPDTEPGTNNLMSGGTLLTEGQIDVLRRSPILEP